jgi:hypothetical protein
MLETPRILNYGYFYPNSHQDHAHRHPFPPRMINKLYYNHLSMALLFQPFISMLSPRTHEISIMSEEK